MSDIIFIKSAAEFMQHKAAKDFKKFSFECPTCHKITALNFSSHTAFPTECRFCKMKATQMRLYGGIGFASSELCNVVRNSCLNKYGTEFPQKTLEVKNKMKTTCELKYGGSCPMQNAHIKEKSANTCFEKYGVSSPLASTLIQSKIKDTFEHLYGGHPMYDSNIAAKTRKRNYIYDNIRFDSNAEIKFYKSLKANGINFIYQPHISFEYEYEGQKHTYHPDFKVNDDYIEIKGAHFFKDGKMINPFDRSQDELYEAKHQCMIRNNIKIIIV